MKTADIVSLVSMLARANIEEFAFSDGQSALRLRFDISQPWVLNSRRCANESTSSTMIKAQRSGLFRLTHPLSDQSSAEVGAAVAAGQILGFLQVNEILLPVQASARGAIGEILAMDNDQVEYGQALFMVDVIA